MKTYLWILMASALLAGACKKDKETKPDEVPANPLVGSWQAISVHNQQWAGKILAEDFTDIFDTKRYFVFTFNDAGKFKQESVTNGQSGILAEGEFSVRQNELTMIGSAEKSVYTYSIDGKRLSLVEETNVVKTGFTEKTVKEWTFEKK